MARAYDANATPQVRADRLVRTETELRNVLGQASIGTSVATIRLAVDVYLTSPLVVSGTYGVVVDGGGQFGIKAATTFVGTELIQLTGPVTSLLFRDVGFVGPTTKLERLVALGSSATALNFERVTLTNIKRIHQSTSTLLYTNSSFVDIRFLGLALSDVTDIGSAQYKRCKFERCYAILPSSTIRTVSVSDTAGSTDLVMIEAGPPTLSTSAVSLQDFATSLLYQLSVTRALTAGLIVYAPTTLTLSTASPTLSPGASSYLQLSMTSGASGSITMDTSGATAGQVLIIEVVSNAGSATIPDSTLNNVRLTAAWNPIGGQTITLLFNGTFWVETARANN